MDPASVALQEEQNQVRQNGLIITASVLVGLSIIVVAIRTVVRFGVIRNSGWDDYTILAALLFNIGYLAEIIVICKNRLGHLAQTLTLENMTIVLKGTLAIQVTYYSIVLFVKLSLLTMFLRFIVSRTARILCYVTIAFHIVFYVVSISGTLGQCRPFHKAYDPTLTVPGSCINTTAFFYFTSGLNIITDVWIFALPIKTLRTINRPNREKITLIGIFVIGMLATIMSIVRLHSIYVYTLAEDPFRDGILVNLWSIIEVNIGILCASVPSLKPLFTPAKLREARGSKRTGYKFHSSERSGIRNPAKSDEELCTTYELNESPSSGGEVDLKSGPRNQQ